MKVIRYELENTNEQMIAVSMPGQALAVNMPEQTMTLRFVFMNIFAA